MHLTAGQEYRLYGHCGGTSQRLRPAGRRGGGQLVTNRQKRTIRAYCAARSAIRSTSRPCTTGGSRWETSPPYEATSLTRLEERKL